jgi:hypothetical protein
MSVPPVPGRNPDPDADLLRQRERELERKAKRYAETHPDDVNRDHPTGPRRTGLGRILAALRRRS